MLEQFIQPLYRLLMVSGFVGLLVCFWLNLAGVSGFRNFLASRSSKFFYKLISCDFCTCFLLSVVFSCTVSYFIPDTDWEFVLFLSTPIA